MGWWQANVKGSQLQLGDEPIDLLTTTVWSVARVYQQELGRKPTFAEFRASLLQALSGDGGESFEDAKLVRDVVFRLREAPKRRPFAVGDYFAISLNGAYYFGRIIHKGSCGHLVEIYSLQTDCLLSVRQLIARKPKVVMNKHVPGRETFEQGRWRIIGHVPLPADLRFPAFFGGGPLAHGRYTLWRGDSEERVTKAEAMKHEPSVLFGPERVEQALLKKEFRRWPEIEECKKRVFGKDHQRGIQKLRELGIPTTSDE